MDSAVRAKTEELVVRRIFDAPIDRVWNFWTDPKLVARWWGPKDYSSPSCAIDLRVGGKYLFCMRAPAEQGGQDSYTAGVYRRIEPKRLLEFTQVLADAEGRAIDPASIGMPPDFPKEMIATVQFEAKGEMTKVTLTVLGWTPSQMFVYALAGWHQSMDKIEDGLARA
jgi:uncharacterized protein YndB with AHSA1/START domain